MTEWKESKIKDFAEVKGGKRLPKGKQLTSVPTKHPYIRIRDLGKSKYLELNPEIEFVDDETQLSIARYIVNAGDILISVVGTIGLIGIVGESLDKANQTENCDKIINCTGIEPEYLYYYLISPFGQEEIKRGTVGAALSTNMEWNTQLVSTEQGEMAKSIVQEFERLWKDELSKSYDEFIEDYRKIYNRKKQIERLIREQHKIALQNDIIDYDTYNLKLIKCRKNL